MIVAAVCCCRKIKKGRSQDRNRPLTCVRSSRLGMAWGNGALVEGCPQVKRAVTTLSGGYRSGSAGGLRLLAAVCLDDFEGEVVEFGEQGAEFLRVVEQGLVLGELGW